MTRNSEYDKFSALLKKVVTVPHSQIQAQLEAEKAAKKRKAKRASSRVKGAKPTAAEGRKYLKQCECGQALLPTWPQCHIGGWKLPAGE